MLRDVFYFGSKPNAHPRERPANDINHARSLCTTEHFWIVNEFCDYTGFDWEFDFDYLPDEEVWTQEHNNVWPSSHVKDSGTWLCTKQDSSIIIYRNDVNPIRRSAKTHNWVTLESVDLTKINLELHPAPKDPPYIYRWGCKYYPVEVKAVLEYHTPGATEIKYMTETVDLLPEYDRWIEIEKIDATKFDLSWRPDPREPAYIYRWGCKYYPVEVKAVLEYHTPGATQVKYMTETVELLPKYDNWVEIESIDKSKFDFSWRPNPSDPPYIYRWGNKFYPVELSAAIEYQVPNATDIKYMPDTVELLPEWDKWVILQDVDKNSFDFSWRPDPREPAFIYVFGNQWHSAEVEPTLEYHVATATEKKYVSDIVANVLPDMKCWEIPNDVDVDDFDFSWRPNPGAPKYIYQFGTLQDDSDGPVYKPVDNNGEIVKLPRVYTTKEQTVVVEKYYIKTTLQDLIESHPNEVFWAIRENINYDHFDFDWRPEVINIAWESDYVHVFGSPDSEMTQTYFVNAKSYLKGKTNLKYVEPDKKADAEYLATLFKQIDMFFVDKGNSESKYRFEQLKQLYPNIQKTRFLNTWVDTISRCINRANTELCWILNSEYDYSNFNFNYYPNPWQMEMVHVFGTQWNQWGNTYIVNREIFNEDTKYIKVIEHLSNINIVKDRRAIATNNTHDIWLIDHGNDLSHVKALLERKSCGKSINIISYDTSYLQTFRNLVKKIPDKKEDYIWLCSSICDYSNFDFSYTVDPFSRDNLHVFPSDKQQFGDTFFVDVNKTKEVIDSIDRLQEYPKANYNNTLRTVRLSAPVFNVDSDTLVGSINTEYNFPYAVFQTEEINVIDQEPISLWSDDMKTITVTSTGATRIIVPKEAKDIVKNELYDYPYIKTASKLGSSKPMDIVFLSNGEQCADENYKHLLAVTKHTKNRVVRVDGVDGRVAAYHAAVEASNTPWAFTVFAKLKVDNKFDWGWQPDRMQIPKHYIFHAKNPVNGLEYGHQGMIAYNKKLTLANQGKGLDFTLDDPHETVKLLSGIAVFNTDPYATWRTAFREVIKLQSDYSDIASERLNIWTTVAEGDFSEYCLQGAKDAVEFYDSVMGDIEELKKSYEWDWLKEYYRKKYR